jgi:competence protein ComEC
MQRHKKQFTLLFLLVFVLHLLVGCVTEELVLDIDSNLEEITREVITNLPTAPLPTDQLKIHFLDVGQAESILVQSQDHFMLIDGGNNDDADFVVKYLQDQGVTKLDYLMGTHPHADHIGGLDVVIDTFEIGKVFMPKVTHTTKTFEDVLLAIQSKGLKITAPTSGTSFELGDAKFTFVAPNNTEYEDLNNYSLVFRLVHGENAFLFTGDAEDISENEILKEGFQIASHVLKVGHHGSSTSTTTAFLDEVNPTFAVISAGQDNQYGHPHKEILAKLKERDITVYRTDESGTIIATSDGKNITFEKLGEN